MWTYLYNEYKGDLFVYKKNKQTKVSTPLFVGVSVLKQDETSLWVQVWEDSLTSVFLFYIMR